jgi:hypothetical protein
MTKGCKVDYRWTTRYISVCVSLTLLLSILEASGAVGR